MSAEGKAPDAGAPDNPLTREDKLLSLLMDAVLRLEGIAEDADRVIRRLRREIESLETQRLDRNPDP
jgi:hypothetical protein